MKAWKQPVFIITALERQTVWVFYSLDMNHKLFNQFYFARAHKKFNGISDCIVYTCVWKSIFRIRK